MLARKYDNYAWERQAQVEEQQPAPRVAPQKDSCRLWRQRIFLMLGIVLTTYLVVVVRSHSMAVYGGQLVELQKQEAQLIAKNNELKIEVEQLKGPERIIGLAEQRLGMSVARCNIYVKSAQAPKEGNSFATNDK